MSRTRTKLVGSVLCIAILGGACSDDDKGGATTATTAPYKVDEGVGSAAATLRANLTGLLQEHVLLLTIATGAQLGAQDAAPATAVLDQNAADLGAAIGSVYDPDTASRFLDPWRRHTAGLVAFTAVATADKPTLDKAKADLTAIQGEIAAVLNGANAQLTVEALSESFGSYATATTAAITAQAKKDETVADKIKTAADTMDDVAIVLAAGIVKQKKDAVPGKLDAISAVMRTELTAKLQEHAYLAGFTTSAALSGGDAEAAGEALDENSLELSRAVGAVYGDEAARRFLELWRQHIEFIVDFTEGAGRKDTTKMDAARKALDGYSTTFAAFLNDANPKLGRTEVEDDLSAHIATLLAAIEAQAAKDPAQVAKLREAAAHMPMTALLLATGIAQQFPAKFG